MDFFAEKKGERMKNDMVHWFKDNCERGLFAMKFYPLNPLCHNLERLRTIILLDAAPCDILTLI